MAIQLIGSRSEDEYRSQLLASRESQFGGNSDTRLKRVLLKQGYDVERAIIINWTPDQGEDIYTVLIWPDTILVVELDREDESIEPLFDYQTVDSYQKSLSKICQIKLAVAFDILSKV